MLGLLSLCVDLYRCARACIAVCGPVSLWICIALCRPVSLCVGVYRCVWVFSSCGDRALLFLAGCQLSHCSGFQTTGSKMCRLRQLWLMDSVVVAHRLNCSMACGILLDQGEPTSPALAGGFLSTVSPGKSCL